MKHLGICMLALLFVVAVGVNAYADPSGSAISHVYLNIDPNISIGAIDSNVDGGTLQIGERSIPITFRIDANTEAVSMSSAVTPLFKGNDPDNPTVDPIPISLEDGVVIDPTDANPIDGESNVAAYEGSPTSISTPLGTFPAQRTNSIIFESSQNGHFSQDVEVTPTWENAEPEQPQGEYSGYVVLYASIVSSINGNYGG